MLWVAIRIIRPTDSIPTHTKDTHFGESLAQYIDRTMRKRVFGHVLTVKAQISLRIRAVWSGPSLSTNRIIGYYRMYEWRGNNRKLLCACARWSESAHFVHVWRHFFAWRRLFNYLEICQSVAIKDKGLRILVRKGLSWNKSRLTLITLGSNFSRRHFEFFFFLENRIWYFMQSVFDADHLQEMSKPVF